MQNKCAVLAVLLLALSLPSLVIANLITNSDFQQKVNTIPDTADSFTVPPGSNTIVGWTISLTAVDLVRVQFGAIDGVSVEPSGVAVISR